MNIAGLVKTSTVDYPDRLACVVFTPGCNYDCWYCHNRALLTQPPLLEAEEVLSFLEKRAAVLEGVVISGGEPTLQPDLIPFATKVKALGYTVKLDTNGSHPEILKQLLDKALVDYVAMDYKAPFQRYPELCGQSAAGVQDCIELLRAADIAWELRTTVVPQLEADDLIAMVKDLPPFPLYALQRYRPVNGEAPGAIYSPAQLYKLASAIKMHQPHVVVRN